MPSLVKFETSRSHDLLSKDGKQALAMGVRVSMSASKKDLQKFVDYYNDQGELIKVMNKLTSPVGNVLSVGAYPTQGLLSVWVIRNNNSGVHTDERALTTIAVNAAQETMRKCLLD